LLQRWHPDRNSTQRDYAERVFNYINQIVLKLENNETIVDTVNDDTGRTRPDMSGSSFGAESSSAFSRGQRYAAAFRDNIQEYNRSTRTGNYSHSRAEKAIVRHIGEAKRWYRQAVFDFKAAETNVISGDKDKSFNWVCYKCHQVSFLFNFACKYNSLFLVE
jgi:DnaJ-class molecular chaperone